MNGGAVRLERSPLNEAMDLRKLVQLPLLAGATLAASVMMCGWVYVKSCLDVFLVTRVSVVLCRRARGCVYCG